MPRSVGDVAVALGVGRGEEALGRRAAARPGAGGRGSPSARRAFKQWETAAPWRREASTRWCSARARRARSPRGAWPTAGSRSRSWSASSSAASAPTGPACRPRPCCARRRRSRRRAASPAPRRRSTGDLDAGAALRRRDEVVHGLSDESQLPWLQERGIELVRGSGVLDGERRVRVGDDVLEARRAVVLATGSARGDAAGRRPAGGGHVDEPRGDDRRDASPRACSSSAAAPVGVELAEAWSSLGSARDARRGRRRACSRARSSSPPST